MRLKILSTPYGASKLFVERMLKDFEAAHGITSIALSNAAGADPDNEIGESHDPETHLIPLVLDAASGRRSDVQTSSRHGLSDTGRNLCP